MPNKYWYYTKYNTSIIISTFRSWVVCNTPFDLVTLSLLYTHNSNRNIRFKLTLLVLGRTSINSCD